MCLIVFSYKTDSRFPFLLAGNRDEFFSRPTLPAHKWNTEPAIFAGKDIQAGGSWLGFTDTGRFAALTNFRDMQNLKNDAPSRGEIVTNFLLDDEHMDKSLKNLKSGADQYNGFNLIAGTFNKLFYLTNNNNEIEEIKPGIHAISNAYLNTPWPKTLWSKKEFEKIMAKESFNEEEIFHLFKNTRRYPIEKLPRTGLPDNLEQAVSSAFILTEDYGTRSTTIVKFNNKLNVELTEHTYKPGTREVINRERLSHQLREKDVKI